ncbi:hypothetical protein C0580_03355 [Candidatus Parcubacteria bacterium]|nr:MAG: hypothetical protein C0580_03355 [Candidatus Parcubacteria bacterium]
MPFDRKQDLPEEVKDIIFGEEIYQSLDRLFKKYHLDRKQIEFILNLLDDIYIQKLEPLDLPQKLEEIDRAKFIDLRGLGLDMARDILWPLQDHLGTVHRLILRLGGKVPKARPIRKKSYQKKVFPGNGIGTLEKMIADYDDFKSLRLTSRKIKDKDGKLTSPTVDNWIADYVHFLGAGFHNALDRAKYLAQSPNALSLSPQEKESLRFFVTSYDDKIEMNFNLDGSILRVAEPEKKEEDKKVENKIDTSQLVDRFKERLSGLDKNVLPESFILDEAENDIKKVRDVLWRSIGLQDKEKVFACLKILVEKRHLDMMLKEDNRFFSILKRFVNMRYGGKYDGDLDSWLSRNLDKLLVRRLFLQMILEDKLALKKEEVMLWAFYLTNIIPKSGQVVYLDENDGEFKWREVQISGENLAWVSNL